MSKFIISALKHHAELTGSLFLAAVELAHRADDNSGIVRISYSYLASKEHCSPRSSMRHVARLIELGIIRRQRFWQHGKKWLVNSYQFLIKWEKPKPPAQKSSSDRMTENLPHSGNSGEKYGSLKEEKEGMQKVLGWLTPGSMLSKLMGGEA